MHMVDKLAVRIYQDGLVSFFIGLTLLLQCEHKGIRMTGLEGDGDAATDEHVGMESEHGVAGSTALPLTLATDGQHFRRFGCGNRNHNLLLVVLQVKGHGNIHLAGVRL